VGNEPLRRHPNRKDIAMIIGNFSYDPDRDTYLFNSDDHKAAMDAIAESLIDSAS
jgi:hypothetical protein